MGGIIWLASYPKSGNTWLRAFLHNLLTNPRMPAQPDELARFTLSENDKGWYDRVNGAPVDGLSSAETIRMRPDVHRLMTESGPDSVFVKTHSYLGEAHGTPLITMDVTAGAIYVVRNPLDVVLSMTAHYGIDIAPAIETINTPRESVADAAHVVEVMGTWSRHVESWTARPNPGLLAIRYEDLLAKPRKHFGAVASFLGLKPSRERLDRAIRFCSFKTLQRLEDRHGFRERSPSAPRFFRTGKAEQWREKLDATQIRRIVDAHRAQMMRFDYVPDGL